MRKISLILAMFVLTAPALAVVTITVDQNDTDPLSFNILYDVNEGEDVRAYALDIFVDNDACIVEVNDFHVGESNSVTPGYGIFPSNFAQHIDPEDPEWDAEDYNPLGDANDYPEDTLVGLDTNGITVELGSLYVGDNNDPCDSGILLEIVVGSDDFSKISLALNQIRGGIVLKDASSPPPEDIVLVPWERQDCLIGGNAGPLEYSDWSNPLWNKPACWCYCRQCRGDADGKKTLLYWVAIPDLSLFKLAFSKTDAVLATIPNGICCDYDHKKTLLYRVAIPDLTIFKTYFSKTVVPNCNSAPVITGPYNFWCDPTNGCPGVCP